MKWLVKFNPKKTESMVISRKSDKPFHPPILMDNNHIQCDTEHKHLGIILCDDRTFGKHIDMITKRRLAEST